MYSCAKKELQKDISYYTTHLRIRELKENGCTMSKRYEGNVKTVECREGEPILFLLCYVFQKGSLAFPFIHF